MIDSNTSLAIIMNANFNMLLMIISKISRNSSILSFIFLIYLCILFQEIGIPALKSLLQDTLREHIPLKQGLRHPR